MAKKYASREAFVDRLQELAEVKSQKKVNENNGVLGTLIDYKKDVNGIPYGIVKENKKYYIKKGNTLNESPTIADFSYIGGLANKTLYQYPSLSDADKNRNMMLQTISESASQKFDKTGKRGVLLNENVNEEDEGEENAEKKIEKAEDALDDLEVATEREVEEPTPEPEDAPAPEETPPPTPEPEDAAAPEETPDAEPEIDDDDLADLDVEDEKEVDKEADVDVEDLTDPSSEIESKLGKLTNMIRKEELTTSQVKSYINSFIAAFKDELPEVEIEDRKEMANKLLKVVDPDTEDIEASIPDELDERKDEEELCNECGEFVRYAEAMGYDKDTIKEADKDEMSNLISGYANAHHDGLNEGDFENVANFATPNVVETLKEEYGHEEYVEKLSEYANKLNECTDEERLQKIDELNWAGLKRAGRFMKDKAGQAIKGTADKISSKFEEFTSSLSSFTDDLMQEYNKEVKNKVIDKLEKMSKEIGETVNKLNQASLNAGEGDINPQSILITLANNVVRHGKADLSRFKSESENKGVVDPAYMETHPNMNEIEDKIEDMESDVDDAPIFDLDAEETPGVVAPEVTDEKKEGLEVNINNETQKIDIKMNEEKIKKYVKYRIQEKMGKKKVSINESKKSSTLKKLDEEIDKMLEEHINEQKVRKYVRNRLEEKMGKKKVSINESKKTPQMKKLDKMIDEQLKIMKEGVKKRVDWNEKIRNAGLSENTNLDSLINDDPTKEEMVDRLAYEHLNVASIDEVSLDDMFDIEAAIYWFSNDYYGGQGSNLYSVLSTSEYKPSPMESSIEDTESEQAIQMYNDLEAVFGTTPGFKKNYPDKW